MSNAQADAKKYAASLERFRAQAELDLGHADEAELHARRALKDEPNSAQAHGLLAGALLAKDRRDEAIAEVKAALAITSEDEWLHRLHALALRDRDNPAALAAANEALRLSPESAPAHYLVSVLSNDLGDQTVAYDAIMRALKLEPTDITYKRTLADLCLDHSPEKAELLYRECLEKDPKNALVLNNLGTALERQKKVVDAAVAFKAALLADPTLQSAKSKAGASGSWKTVLTVVLLVLIAVRLWMLGEYTVASWIAVAVVAAAIAVAYNRFRLAQIERADPRLVAIYDELLKSRS